ncbi:hypothetical protein AB5I41_28320 [Sphingomonas sp. MMS24-JH45]
MRPRMIRRAGAMLLLATASVAASAPREAPVAFRLDEGRNLNAFFRDGGSGAPAAAIGRGTAHPSSGFLLLGTAAWRCGSRRPPRR